jgi:ABC-2 type transport system ATP-binding protein
VGYLPGTLALYENLTVGKFLEFIEHLRRVDCHGTIPELCERLQLSTSSPIKSLSKGNKQKVGVVQAFMHSPSVLILDEPTAGLDPIVQREFEILVREHRDRGAAVLLSSHVLGEVEQLVSDVVILDRGHLVMHDNLHELKSRIERRLRFDFATTPPSDLFVGCVGISHFEVSDYSITCTVVGSEAPVLERAARANVETVRTYEPSLDDIFLSATAGSRNV